MQFKGFLHQKEEFLTSQWSQTKKTKIFYFQTVKLFNVSEIMPKLNSQDIQLMTGFSVLSFLLRQSPIKAFSWR